MLLDYIERARNQPKEVKQRMVWIWSITFTGIIVLIWLSVIVGRHYAESGGVDREVINTPAQTTTNTKVLFEAANDFLDTPSTAFKDITTYTTETQQDVSSSTASSTQGVVDEMGSSTLELWP